MYTVNLCHYDTKKETNESQNRHNVTILTKNGFGTEVDFREVHSIIQQYF